jgi:hypothetical protein
MQVQKWGKITQGVLQFEYKPVSLSTSNKGWKAWWFYTKNIEDGLSMDIDSPATPNPN